MPSSFFWAFFILAPPLYSRAERGPSVKLHRLLPALPSGTNDPLPGEQDGELGPVALLAPGKSLDHYVVTWKPSLVAYFTSVLWKLLKAAGRVSFPFSTPANAVAESVKASVMMGGQSSYVALAAAVENTV